MSYKSKNATISERLTGTSNKDGFESARKLVKSGWAGVNQKEADAWLRKEWIKQNWWKVVSWIAGIASGITAVWELFS